VPRWCRAASLFRAYWETIVATPAIRRIGGVLITASMLCLSGALAPAAAQSLFEALFGGGYQRPEPLPPQASSYADPLSLGSRDNRRSAGDSGSFGHGTVFCVRTCDGRYFPMQRHAGASPAEICRSFCPASKTMVFSGSKIDYAVAPNGTRYADLDRAFVYRDKVVDNCTCNGKDGLGLARLDTASDPTLRAGDIVVTNDGLSTFHGKSGAKSAEFTPINPSSSEWARKLSEVKVRRAPPTQKIEPVANDEGAKHALRGRLQAAR
jgi:hypothetical protein